MYVLLHAEPSGLNGGGNQHCPPPQIFCWKLANSLPPPPPPCNSPPKCLQQIFCYQFVAALQFPVVHPAPSNTVAATNALPLNISVTKHSPPQMPAADVLRPVCCCPPISCGAPCTLYPAAQLQLPTPAPLMVVPPPPNFLLPVPCSEMANSLPPPPTPAADVMPSLLSPTTAPPNACSRFSAASLLLPSNFLWCTLHPAAQLQPAHPCPLHGGVPPPTPPPKFSAANPRRSIQQIFCCQFPAAQARPCSHPKDKQLKVCHRFGERCGGC